MKIEKRFFKTEKIELRAAVEGVTEQRYADGVGIVYGQQTELFDGFFESIRAGAFDETLKSGEEIKSFFNHEPNFVLATTNSNPALELNDAGNGLSFSAPIPPTSYGDDLIVNLERGNVRGASFSFSVVEDTVTYDREKDIYFREITKAKLYEIGPVTNPAYPQTEVSARSTKDLCEDIKKRCKDETEETPNEADQIEPSNLAFYRAQLQLTERGI